jgi:hypothetical protein
MTSTIPPTYIGETRQKAQKRSVTGEYVHLLGEEFYKISNYDSMDPFFMSLVSSSNHWMFISSTGGLSAGRINAGHALFPYYTVDKLTENFENTGAKALFLVSRGEKKFLWEPFSNRLQGVYDVERNLYKNIPGNVLLFEEVNHSLDVTYFYSWRTGDRFGFVKSSWLSNNSGQPCRVEVLDGMQNVLPANVSDQQQNVFSTLLDAYKRNELDPELGMGIFTLNSYLTDLAEPSESLLCTVVWQTGLKADHILLSSQQVNNFRAGMGVTTENEVRGQRGSYFTHAVVDLDAGREATWHVIADVDQDAAAVVDLSRLMKENGADLPAMIESDLAANTESLNKIIASADGLQVTDRPIHTAHHFANVMFNEMRGGYFPGQYLVSSSDFTSYVSGLNKKALKEHASFFKALPAEISVQELRARAKADGSADLIRLASGYLPLAFSRRHGDPSRPWNRFSINIRKKDGSQQLDYEGNWRDIFQNWEALAYSYPEYTESMIFTFLNATTVDGYNPYRVTRHGIDWEIPEPGNPWANIGYWSDHQIIYLLKLMEISRRIHPDFLEEALTTPVFSYADVPYRIKPFCDILRDPYNTIDFDWDLEKHIQKRVASEGNDGKLVHQANDGILYGSLTEKLLTLLLAKLVNFVPEGGIWMTTQRPEWNDANNALVGKGLSVVTLAYMRRYVVFVRDLLAESKTGSMTVHSEVEEFFKKISSLFMDALPLIQGKISDTERFTLMEQLGKAGSDYRWNYYQAGLSGKNAEISKTDLVAFLNTIMKFIDHTLKANRRSDGLFNSYNTLCVDGKSARVSTLYEMLEGQVAVLSSEFLSGEESLALLTNMRGSQLFREDQHTYILYPNHKVKGFVEKNTIAPEQVKDIPLVNVLQKAGDGSLMTVDQSGNYHFAGAFHNFHDVKKTLDELKVKSEYSSLVEQDTEKIARVFEQTFQHDQFTGRSGTFFAFEGLGSIYWHMVSKLLLAVQETIQRTRNESSTAKLIEFYKDIRAGQCFNKSPQLYGAFPTDPYSHTPAGQGAKQPGMSGMVKEEILARQAELGFTVVDGCIAFDFLLFDRNELLKSPSTYRYLDVLNQWQEIPLQAGTLAYSICQVPVLLESGKVDGIEIHYSDGSSSSVTGSRLDKNTTDHIFARDNFMRSIIVRDSGF